MSEESYDGDYSHFDESGTRFLFPFTDIDPDLLEGEHDLGLGWTLTPITWSHLASYGVQHHHEAWQAAHYGGTNWLLPNGYERNEGKYGAPIKNQDKWRFCMIWAREKNVGIGPQSISQALAISDLDLLIGARSDGSTDPKTGAFWPQFVGRGVRNRPTPNIATGKHPTPLNPTSLIHGAKQLPGLSNLDNARMVIEWRRRKLGDDSQNVLNAIFDFQDLDRLHDYLGLKHLGYFAIIESLLSHCPNASDPVDSIARQIKRNLLLVQYRLSEVGSDLGIDHFGETAFEKVISKLYSYRSAVAHGGNIAGAVSDINKLRPGGTETTIAWIHDLLRTLVRRILQAAVREPSLFQYLK